MGYFKFKSFAFSFLVMFFTFAGQAQSQTDCFTAEYFGVYDQVMSGRTDFAQLDAQTQSCVVDIHRVLSRSTPPRNTSDCQNAWDWANSAAADVVSYAQRLIRCVENGDHSDSCYTEARRVRNSQNDYESAVSEVQYECY